MRMAHLGLHGLKFKQLDRLSYVITEEWQLLNEMQTVYFLNL